MIAPIVKGWCPGAHRPMASGDGLVVRVRPMLGELSVSQALTLCDLAERFGTENLELTSRANLQIRGVAEADHPALVDALIEAELLEEDAETEARRNILMTPDWEKGDLSERLSRALVVALPGLPKLPAKMGYAVDTGPSAVLGAASADFRFELTSDDQLLLRADGAEGGWLLDEGQAIAALVEMIEWFVETGGPEARRMSRHVTSQPLPQNWRTAVPRMQTESKPGTSVTGPIYGAAFGALPTEALRYLISHSEPTALRVMPGRLFQLRGGSLVEATEFVTEESDPRLRAHACSGAPSCPQATVETRVLASRLSKKLPVEMSLHVSGCAKGCALPRKADLTLVGCNGAFDLVRDGTPWDEPTRRNLDPTGITDLSEL